MPHSVSFIIVKRGYTSPLINCNVISLTNTIRLHSAYTMYTDRIFSRTRAWMRKHMFCTNFFFYKISHQSWHSIALTVVSLIIIGREFVKSFELRYCGVSLLLLSCSPTTPVQCAVCISGASLAFT